MANEHLKFFTDVNESAIGAVAVDISATDHTFTQPTTAIYVGGTGDVKVDLKNGDTVTYSAVPVGTVLRIAATKVYKTGTTATLMIAEW